MKRILYAFFILLSIQKIYAQSSIILPNGTVIPSFTQATRPATPTRGQLIYQTDGTVGLYIWSGTAWTAVSTGSGGTGTVTNVTGTAPLSVTNNSTTPTISISQANGTTNGFLSSTDWNTFNNKQNTLQNANSTTSGILTSTDWNTFNNKQNTLQNANATTSGILTSTDWNTFNSKQNPLPDANATTSGILTSTDWNTFNNKQSPLPDANATTSGILTSADWNTFNDKQNPLSNANSTTSGILTSADWNTFNNKQNTLSNANATTSGILTSADWNTFNNKQNPLPDANTTTSGILTSADWNTFNNKQNTLQNANSNTSGVLTSADWNTFNNKQNPLSNANATTSGILTSADWNNFNNKQNTLSNANSTTSGILTSADWNTFNNKQNPLPDANATTSGILTSTDWNTFNNKQNTLPNANATTSGILTSADWNTFNNKQNFLFNANASISGILTSADWNKFNNKQNALNLQLGGIVFGSNSQPDQDNLNFFWENTNKRLGIGTITPTHMVTIKSKDSGVNNSNSNQWVAVNIGAQQGKNLVLGVRNGRATIGATDANVINWDTLNLSPGGKVMLGGLTGATKRLLMVDSKGVIQDTTTNIGNINPENGLILTSGKVGLGGSLSRNTIIKTDSYSFSLRAGSNTANTTVNNSSGFGYSALNLAVVGQSFKTQTNGTLKKIYLGIGKILFNTSAICDYTLYSGDGYNGPILKTGQISLPNPGIVYTEIPLDVPSQVNQSFTIKVAYTTENPIIYTYFNSNLYSNGRFIADSPFIGPNEDIAFYITESTNESDLLYVDSNQKFVGIGTNTPKSRFSVASDSLGTWVAADFGATSNSKVVMGLKDNRATIGAMNMGTGNMDTLNINPNGIVKFPTLAGSGNRNLMVSSNGTLITQTVQTFSANAPLSISGSNVLSLSQAGASSNGYLSSTDWNTFNNKLTLPSLTNGSILFSNGTTISQSNANLFWDNTNKALGIGTSSPNAGLHINGYGWDNGFRISNSGGIGPAVFLDGDTDFALISTSSGAGAGANKFGIFDATANLYRMVINNSGAMGLGSVNPATKLEVNGLGGLKVSSNYTNSGYTDWVSGNFGGQIGDRLVVGVFNQTPTIGGHNSDLNEWRNLALNPIGGNVGIGTDAPTAKLDVAGSVRLRTGAAENAVLVSDANGNASWNSKTPLRTASVAVTVPPTVTLGGQTSFGMAEVEWVHNLGYQPIIMITNEQANDYSLMEYVRTSYYHVDNNTLKIRCTNAAGGVAQGTFRILIVN